MEYDLILSHLFVVVQVVESHRCGQCAGRPLTFDGAVVCGGVLGSAVLFFDVFFTQVGHSAASQLWYFLSFSFI